MKVYDEFDYLIKLLNDEYANQLLDYPMSLPFNFQLEEYE